MPKSLSATTVSRCTRRARNVLALGALLVAGITIAPPARPDTLAPGCASAPSPETTLDRVNAVRQHGATCRPSGAAPLRWSANLAAVAAAQARAMVELNEMSHRDAQNRALPERLAAMDYRFSTAVENVAVGYESLDAVVEAWLDSASHCDNLMDAKVLELGLACSDSGAAPEGRYWTLVLGAPRRSH